MVKCKKCLYKKNCQFLANRKKLVVEDCSAFENENKIKTEAVKEFAEKVEKEFSKIESQMPNSRTIQKTFQIYRNAVQIVLKELVGDNNA